MIQIYRNGEANPILELQIPEGAIVHRELMGDHYVRFQFSLGEPVYLHVGDWCFIEGFGRFELTEPYAPKYNISTGGYDYDLQLDAYYIKWKNKLCRYVPASAASETSFHLTATIDVHLEVIVNTINSIAAKDSSFLYNGETEFDFTIGVDVPSSAKYKHYDNTDIISALNDLADIFDCEWWVDDNYIRFGRLELDGEPVPFTIDDNVEDFSSTDSKKEYANRLYVFGSDRNLPKDYRKDSTADITKNGVVQKRLMLPLSGVHACPYGYVQDGNLTETDAVEAVMVDEDIYPKLECEVSEVIPFETVVKDENGNTVYEDGHEGEAGYEEKHTFYRIKDRSGFKLIYDDAETGEEIDMRLEGLVPHILFTSGRLNGMDFECIYDKAGDYYEIVENEDYGRPLPDSSLCPMPRRTEEGETIEGDKFIIYNWDSTKIGNTSLIDAAEEALYQSAIKKLEKLKIDSSVYTCKMMSSVYEESMYLSGDSYAHYNFGQKVTLNIPAISQAGRQSRVIGYELNLDIPYDSPKYIVGEATAYRRSQDVQSQIDALTFNGVTYRGGNGSGGGIYIITTSSNTPASDTNVYSALRSRMEFVSKRYDDIVQGLLKFVQGATFGDFMGGLVGYGGKIDGHGHGELESLSLRRFLEVPELRYNRVSIYVGNQWRAPGGGIIESVTPDYDQQGNILSTGTIKLHLEEGEIGTIDVDDICQGIFHDGMTLENNETVSFDDGIGNFKFAGFFTSYFRVTEILDNAKNSRFRYALRPTNSLPRPTGEAGRTAGGNWTQQHHPCEAMHFVAYGNFTNTDRQSSRYSTLTYERFLTGVNWWEFNENNIGAQFGDLSNLSIFGLNMTGYSAYLNNIYMSGTIQQFENLPLRMEIDTQGDSFLGIGESMLVTCTVLRGWEDVTSQVTRWEVVRDSGDAVDDAAWLYRSKVVAFYRGNPRPAQEVEGEEYLDAGQIILCHDTDPTIDDLGNTNVLSTLFTFRAYLEDGSNSQFQLVI